MFQKGAEYDIDGVEIKVKDQPSSQPVQVDIRCEKTKGMAAIKLYPGKDNAIVVTRPSKQESKPTMVLALQVVKRILGALLNKTLSDEGLKRLIESSNKKNVNKTKNSVKFLICDDCDKVFTSEHGMTIHVGKAHKKHTKE